MIVTGILASAWNKLIDHVKRNRIRDVVVLNNGPWLHPWTVSPRWNADQSSSGQRSNHARLHQRPGRHRRRASRPWLPMIPWRG